MSLPKIRIPIVEGLDPIDVGLKEAGQIIVIFALMLTALIGLVGIAIDVTYAWRNALQVQRAADAAAMAGVVYMPGNLSVATDRADAIATSNGYTGGNGFTVLVAANPADNRQLDVTITAPVQTFFVRLFGINQWTVTRSARAAYILPVPMGSPLAYMGVGCFVLSTGTAPTCNTTGTGQSGITTAGTSGGTSLGSLGAFGAVITRGGDESNGDAYLPTNNSGGSPTNNVLYSAPPTGQNGYKGYFYTVNLPAGGSIQIFDPGFCAMGSNGHGGSWGTGDHWIGTAGTPVSTYYSVLDTHNVPLNPGGWTPTGDASGSTFENQKGYDPANGGNPGGATSGCDAYHDKWYTLASSLGAGTYEVEVTTTNTSDATINANTNAENMFGIMATGGGSVAVYGYDKMAVYNNLMATGVLQQFYMAKVDQQTGAGKTLTIDLFDVGDSTAGYIQILGPDGPAGTQRVIPNFSYSTYNYNASGIKVSPGNCIAGKSDACSASGRDRITVATSANGSSFNNTWIEITVPLLTTYGQPDTCGTTSDQPCLWQGGWWQVQYNVTAGNDTTTWSVNVNGNPVHLVPIP